MKPSLTIIDQFAPDIAQVRAAIIAGPLADENGPDGARYTNISRHPVPHWKPLLEQAIGFSIDIKLECFRYDFAGQFPHNHVHADVVCAEYAALVYLNPDHQCRGGTAFWKHLPTGRERMPALAEVGEEAFAQIEADWIAPEQWELSTVAGMRQNRLIIYPTTMFHSRYPHEGFGQGRRDGRLVWVCFFSKAKPPITDAS